MKWTSPEILKFLFSSWHGLYSWTPILIFSTLGLFLLYKTNKRIAIGLLSQIMPKEGHGINRYMFCIRKTTA